jgi:hypothetical protein
VDRSAIGIIPVFLSRSGEAAERYPKSERVNPLRSALRNQPAFE